MAEVAYDRALINLAAEFGIDVTPANFVHPRIERDRLEMALANKGLDLAAPEGWSRGHEEPAEP